MILRIGRIAERIADDIERNSYKRHNGCREHKLISQRAVHHQYAAGFNQIAQRSLGCGYTKTNIGKEHFVAYGAGNRKRRLQHNYRNHLRQQVLYNYPQRAAAKAAGRQIIVPIAEYNDLIADKAGHGHPTDHTHGYDYGGHARAQYVAYKDQYKRLRDITYYIIYLRQRFIKTPYVTPCHAYYNAKYKIAQRDHKADYYGRARAGPYPCPKVLTYCICSEPIFAARRKVAKVHAGFGVIVYCNGVMLIGQQRLNESEGNYRYQRNYQYACSPIAPKVSERARPV